jgi:hypothetical protein
MFEVDIFPSKASLDKNPPLESITVENVTDAIP